VMQLKESLNFRRVDWEAFEIPKLEDIADIDPAPELLKEIDKLLEVRKSTIESQDWWSKGRRIIKNAFKAISPLAKNILQIAKEGQSVRYYPS
jgi:hypothetical protein